MRLIVFIIDDYIYGIASCRKAVKVAVVDGFKRQIKVVPPHCHWIFFLIQATHVEKRRWLMREHVRMLDLMLLLGRRRRHILAMVLLVPLLLLCPKNLFPLLDLTSSNFTHQFVTNLFHAIFYHYHHHHHQFSERLTHNNQ